MDNKHGEDFDAIKSDSSRYSSTIPLFSICVPTYNRKDLLKQTLLSILSQTFTDFEVIVGNDYIQEPLSSDLLGVKDPRIRFINYSKNLGELANQNALLSMARGKYFTWQFDDDLYAPNFLESVYSALVRFDLPLCVFTSYKVICDTSYPYIMKRYSRHGQLFSGRQFLRRYLSGRIKAMGCTGVYNRDYLRSVNGVESLTDSPFALYSEYLILIRAGLLKKVAYLNSPLVLFRVHENGWGGSNTAVDLYKQAGENLVRESIELFKRSELKDDFSKNLSSILKFTLNTFVRRFVYRDGYLNKREVEEYLYSIKEQFKSLKGSVLYKVALDSLNQARKGIIWHVAIAKVKLKAPYCLVKFARRAYSFFSGCGLIRFY